MKDIIKKFFDEVNNKNINYVVWKNTNLIEDFFLGKENLDIYINDENFEKLQVILMKYHWIKLVNNIRNYKFIHHFFLFTNDKTYHLHIYIKIITGDSILKEYDFTSFIKSEDKYFSNKHKLWILDPNIQLILFKLRFLIKRSNFLGNYLFKKQKKLYVKEFLYLKNSIKVYNSIFYDFKNKYFLNKDIDNNLTKFDKVTSKIILRNILKYKIRNIFENNKIYINILINLIKKKIFKTKNFSLHKGIGFFISGCDASGKSTIVNNINNIYKKTIDVDTFTIGKPYPKFIIQLAKIKKIKKNIKFNEYNKNKIQNQNTFTNIKNVNLAFLRYFTYLRIKNAINKKKLVICDRYISNNVNEINGPRIMQTSKNKFTPFFQFLELYFYNKIKPMEFEIRLITDLDSAIDRNNQREKNIYKKENEIIKRYNLFEKSTFKSVKKYLYQNDNKLPETIKDILSIVNKIILSKK